MNLECLLWYSCLGNMTKTIMFLAVVQFSAAAYWYGVTSGWVLPQWGAIEPRQLLLGLAALLAGQASKNSILLKPIVKCCSLPEAHLIKENLVAQALNLGAYRALKTKGIYYGTKLGYKVKWQTGFPFNVVAHPQYVGSALTVWAFPALLWNQPAADNTSLLLLAAYWTALYVVTALQEQYLEGGPDLSSPVVHREPLFDSPVLHHRHVKEEHEVKVKAEPVY